MSSQNRWQEAKNAVEKLAPYVCKFDPDGIDLIFFDHDATKVDNIKSAEEVQGLFSTFRPRGSTNLAYALHLAFQAHFDGQRGATTIMCVTDGSPDSKSEVERVIRRAANSIDTDAELSVSFVQIGNDRSATQFLGHLDDTLSGVKFDIVDTITAAEAAHISVHTKTVQ